MHTMNCPVNIRVLALLLLSCPALAVPRSVHAQDEMGERYALLIGGLGGNDSYSETFQEYLFDTRQALIEEFQIPADHITVLAEDEEGPGNFVTGVSTADQVRKQFRALSRTTDQNDQVYIVLFGHGSFDGERASLNIPRRDLSDADFAELLDSLTTERTVFINTTNSSGPFIQALSGTDRIIITATRSGRQKNETVFPRFFVDGLTDPAADLDQNNRLSVREAFQYAARKTGQWFSDQGHVASEHALLEDTGDGEGARLNELAETSDGNLAAATYFHPPEAPAVAGRQGGDSLAAVQARQQALEKKIASLKNRKSEMAEETYYQQLEELLIQLARLTHPADSTRPAN